MDYLSKVMTAAIWGEQPPEAPVWNQLFLCKYLFQYFFK